jgi:hypothetical protein
MELISIIYMIYSNDYKFLNTRHRDIFITKLDNFEVMTEIINEIDPILKFCFSDKLINNPNLEKIKKVPRISIIYLLHKNNLVGLNKYHKKIFKLINSVAKQCNNNKIQKQDRNDLNRIQNFFDKKYKKLFENAKKSNNEDDDNDNSDNDDSDNNENVHYNV